MTKSTCGLRYKEVHSGENKGHSEKTREKTRDTPPILHPRNQ